MKFIVDLDLDGYENKDEMREACKEFIMESLDFSGSSVTVEDYSEDDAIDLAQHAPAEEEATAAAHDARDNHYMAQGG